MAGFKYHEIKGYGKQVVDTISSNKGKIKVINRQTYTIDTSKGSKFAVFKKLVDDAHKSGKDKDYQKAIAFASEKEKNKAINQFEILKPSIETRKKHKPNTKKLQDKWDELSWTEIDKIPFSQKGPNLNTKQQESITLKIIENVLGSNSITWKSFGQMFDDKKSGIQKIFPKLKDPKLVDWWNNFELQFSKISDGWTEFPNSNYDVYKYDGKGSFMEYISDLVVKDLNLYSKKDSWNPADIWLVNSKNYKTYIGHFDAIKEKLDNGDYAGDKYQAIREINIHLRTAYDNNDIVGISLKKSDGKTLNYVKFNLQADETKQKLPNVEFKSIKLDCTYIDNTYKFKSKTSQVFVDDGARGAFKMSYKSNTGENKIGNITYEFLPDGPASAQLGKVPKDKLTSWLKEQIKLNTGDDVLMPQHENLPDEWSDDVKVLWEKKVELIQKKFTTGTTDIKNFVKNLEDSYNNGGGLTIGNATMMQMVDFTWILAKMKDTKPATAKEKKQYTDILQKFLTLCYYFAQKKGIKYNFGPFGKMY